MAKSLLDNIIRNASEIGRDLGTFGGYLGREGVKQYNALASDIKNLGGKQAVLNAFNKAINNPNVRKATSGAIAGGAIGSAIPILGTIPGAIMGGTVGLVGSKEFVNANIAPYNLSVDYLKSKPNPLDVISRVSSGAYENPITATIDVLSLGGAKAIGSAVSKYANKPGKTLRTVGEKELFRDITEGLNKSKVDINKYYAPINQLKSQPLTNRTALTRYITLNDSKGLTKDDIILGNDIKRVLNEAQDTAINNKWLDHKEAKNNVIAQYVMGKHSLDNQALLHADVMEYLETGKNSKITDAMKKDIDIAKDLYKDGKISYLTQAIVNSYDPTGLVVARDLNKSAKDYYQTRRVIGRSMAEDIDRKLDQSLEFQLDKVYRAKEAQDITNNLLMQYGRAVRKGDKLNSNEVVVKPSVVSNVIKKSFVDENSRTIDSYLRSVGTTGEGIAIDRQYLNAIANAMQGTKNVPFGSAMNIIKRTLLAQPHWIALNRVGNTTNNIMEGVGTIDYIDTIKYKKYIPDQLKQQTSFNHFIDGTNKSKGVLAGSKSGVTDIINSVKNFNENDPKKYKRLITGLLDGSNKVLTEPIFKAESSLELMDRYANYIRQAKRLASKKGVNVESILKQAKTDNKLYNELNNKVNKTLGDYMGRDYNISPETYAKISMLVPFYRFLTQTARTTGHQLANRGLAFQSLVGVPAKIGSGISQDVMNALGIQDKDYIGGVPYDIVNQNKYSDTYRMMRMEPLPIGSLLEDASKLIGGQPGEGIISPLYTIASDLIQGTKFGRQISTPEIEAMKALGLDTKDIKLTPEERWKYAGNVIAGLLSSPYRLSTTYIPELVAYETNQGLKSRFDTDPYRQIPSSYKRKGGTELLGKWLGLQNISQYVKKPQQDSPKKMVRRQQNYNSKVK